MPEGFFSCAWRKGGEPVSEGTPPFRYDARLANEIELKWQDRWGREGTFQSANPPSPSSQAGSADPSSARGRGRALSDGFARVTGRPKFYLLDFFPYPSGIGLHVGHPVGYIGTDVYGRYLRMTGHHVLHPFGFDTFGLPAEQYALDTGQHPAVTVRQNAAVIRRQLRRLGLAHDRRREILTSDPSYYRWTQWIFLRIFNSWYDRAAGPLGRARPVSDLVAEFAAGRRPTPDGRAWQELSAGERRDVVDGYRLAYLAEEIVNWCPGLGTVLADEEVTDEGRSAVGNYPVYRRPLRQWMLRITAFAERLLADLDGADWPDSVKRLQRNWIGPSGGPYHLKDWLFSRQRYWGEPFPIVYDAADPDPKPRPIALPEAMLPVTLPEMKDFRPVPQDDASDPVPALSRAPGWTEITLDLGDGPRRYRRELSVMPQWAGSSWYYLRYLDPFNDAALVGQEAEHYWMPPAGVDLYVGGVEHAVLHLLYARFWHKVLYDHGVTETAEPFGRLFNQGYILADAFTDSRGQYVPAADVTRRADGWEYRGQPVTRRAGKMGKSLKNGVSPDDIYDSYGADTLRLYEMAMGPLDGDRPWHTDDIIGMHRFLQRLWRLIVDEATGETLVSPHPSAAGHSLDAAAAGHSLDAATAQPLDAATARLLHQTIAAVRNDFAALRFNTAIARIIELTAHASRLTRVCRDLAEPLVLMVAPLAPHVAEELWQRLGHSASLAYEPFPQADPSLAAEESVTLPVQVNGKLRFTIEVPAGAGQADIAEVLARHPDYPRHDIARLIIVPGKIVNVVLR
jgi:leucyl-tRNA synthetase